MEEIDAVGGELRVEDQVGPQALEMIRAAVGRGEPYDLGLLDMMMPGMDGLELGGCPRIGIVARKWGSEAKLA